MLNALVQKGYEVLIPWGDHYPYDLAIYLSGEGKMLRIQCKVARLSSDERYISFNPYVIVPGERGRRSVKRGYKGEAEYFGVYSPDLGKIYLIAVDDIPCGGDVRLRLKVSKNNQEKGVRWAKDYEI